MLTKFKFFISVLFILWGNTVLFSQENTSDFQLKIEQDGFPQKPPLSVQKKHSVYDFGKLLSAQERRQLEEKISKYYDSTSTQIVIASIKNVNDDISLYATEWAHKWGIGQKDKGNGVFILISKDDRKVTIRTGYGVEHLLTDALSKRIIERDIIPFFRQGKYYKGLDKALKSIQNVLNGEFDKLSKKPDSSIPFWFFVLLFIIIIIIIVSSSKNNNFGGPGGSSTSGGPIIFTSSGRSSWGGGFSGGFSGGFGGGGFGGGGATGSW